MPFSTLALIMMQLFGLELANLGTNCHHSVFHRTLVYTHYTHYIQRYHQSPFRSQDNHSNIFSRNFVENNFTHFYCAWSFVVRKFQPLYLGQKISNCEWHLCTYKSNPFPAVGICVSVFYLILMLTKFCIHEEWHCFITCKRCVV